VLRLDRRQQSLVVVGGNLAEQADRRGERRAVALHREQLLERRIRRLEGLEHRLGLVVAGLRVQVPQAGTDHLLPDFDEPEHNLVALPFRAIQFLAE
jgi:hypothetical protein